MIVSIAIVISTMPLVLPLDGTSVETDYIHGRVDVTSVRKDGSKRDPSTRHVVRRPKTPRPTVVVTTDPDGSGIKCVREANGEPYACEPIVFRDAVERELREQVRIATRSIGIPGLQVQTRPQPEALINIDTMLYTEADTFERTVNLLGRDVTIRAVPSQFMWHHGDGTTQTTRSPGKSTASSDVAHVYRKPVVGLRLSVDTTWRIEYRVASGPWRELDETLTVSGPVTTLTTREARPILVGP